MSKKKKRNHGGFTAIRRLSNKDLVVLPGEQVPQAILDNAGEDWLLERGHIERATSLNEHDNTMSDPFNTMDLEVE